MELISVIRDRRSVRDYMDVAVDRATIEHLIDAAILAPSSLNPQTARRLCQACEGLVASEARPFFG